ncbi:ABC transporter ATP-binding protein [Pseudomonas sp. dw_358]|uniref:ABC transporter ATP-binding protein n=1 Tax=Pseudomonas sp. dw_358 TaxID=2720083 RepID=UPI001BD57FA5|nr:ABC transporter ATP-binding protein [Pseudomonas sp. dw_358]
MSLILEALGLSYRIATRTVLNRVSMQVAKGDCIALLGANGAGKSTLLRLLLGLLKTDDGEVLLDGQPLTGLSRRHIARRLAYVPQSHVPSFPYRVREVVSQGRLPSTGLGRGPNAADHLAVDQALAQLGIEHLAPRLYTELSGGERQLTLIARALVQEAQVIVLDEPVAGLDYGHQQRLLEHLQRLAAQGLSILCSSHHPEHALAWANRVWVLEHGQLIADGTPFEVIDAPLIERLYQRRVGQIDLPPHRFFVPL